MKPKHKELGAMAAVGEIHGPRGANGWSGACDTVGNGFPKTSEVNNTPEGSETSEVDNTVEDRLNPGVHPKLWSSRGMEVMEAGGAYNMGCEMAVKRPVYGIQA